MCFSCYYWHWKLYTSKFGLIFKSTWFKIVIIVMQNSKQMIFRGWSTDWEGVEINWLQISFPQSHFCCWFVDYFPLTLFYFQQKIELIAWIQFWKNTLSIMALIEYHILLENIFGKFIGYIQKYFNSYRIPIGKLSNKVKFHWVHSFVEKLHFGFGSFKFTLKL